MTVLYCFIDQRLASLLYYHYSENLSLYKCCVAKLGCTTIIVLLQIVFDRRCSLRKPHESRTLSIEPPSNKTSFYSNPPSTRTQPFPNADLEMTNRNHTFTEQPNSLLLSQQTNMLNSETPSFNLRSAMKSTPKQRQSGSNQVTNTFSQDYNITMPTTLNPIVHRSDVDVDAIESVV